MKLKDHIIKWILPTIGGYMTADSYFRNHFPSADDVKNYGYLCEAAKTAEGKNKENKMTRIE